MTDNRFKDYPIDARFPGGGADVRFQNFPVDGQFPELGLDTRFMGSAYGADTAAPIVSNIVWDTITDPANPTLTFDVNENCTLRALTSASATPMSAAAIASGAVVTQALAIGDGYLDYDDSADPTGTRYLHWSVTDAAGNATVPAALSYVKPTPAFTETWAAYTVGDTWTQVDANYDRSASLSTSIVTDAGSPSGKGMSLIGTSASTRYIWRPDIASALALRTTQRVNILAKKRLGSGSNSRSAIGTVDGSLLNTGALLWRGATTTSWNIACQLAGDVNALTNKTDVLTGLSDGAIYWIRVEYDGLDVKVRAWLDGGSEPGTWTTRTAGAAIAVPRLDLVTRTVHTHWTSLGYSIAIGADAPGF